MPAKVGQCSAHPNEVVDEHVARAARDLSGKLRLTGKAGHATGARVPFCVGLRDADLNRQA